jgi:hypothetical protein
MADDKDKDKDYQEVKKEINLFLDGWNSMRPGSKRDLLKKQNKRLNPTFEWALSQKADDLMFWYAQISVKVCELPASKRNSVVFVVASALEQAMKKYKANAQKENQPG